MFGHLLSQEKSVFILPLGLKKFSKHQLLHDLQQNVLNVSFNILSLCIWHIRLFLLIVYIFHNTAILNCVLQFTLFLNHVQPNILLSVEEYIQQTEAVFVPYRQRQWRNHCSRSLTFWFSIEPDVFPFPPGTFPLQQIIAFRAADRGLPLRKRAQLYTTWR